MALVLKDRISETTTTTGTGTITLAGATSGFQAFSTIGNGNTTYYCITDGVAWEVGLGTYTSSGNTFARTTVYSNSNGNTSPITLGAGVKNVFATLPADGIITVSGSSIQVPGTAVLTVPNGGTGINTATSYSVVCGGTTSTGAFQSVSSVGSSGQVLTSNGAGALPTWQTSSGISTGKSIAMAMIFGF